MQPKTIQKQKTIESSIENLPEALDFIQEHATLVSESAILPLTIRLLAEEAITNIMRHGYEGKKGPIQIRSSASESDFTIELRDAGTPFNPTIQHERTKEGSGLQLLHAICDSIEYERESNLNVLTLKKMLVK